MFIKAEEVSGWPWKDDAIGEKAEWLDTQKRFIKGADTTVEQVTTIYIIKI